MTSASNVKDKPRLSEAINTAATLSDSDPQLHPAFLHARIVASGRNGRPHLGETLAVRNDTSSSLAEARMELLGFVAADDSECQKCRETTFHADDHTRSQAMESGSAKQSALQEQFLKAKQEAKAREKAEELDSSKRRVERPVSGENTSQTIKQWMTPEDYAELGYPEYDAKFKDKEYMAEQLKLEMVDPRVNPNLLLSPDDREFWNNAMRKPFNKQMMRSEDCWNTRRKVWIKQYESVQDANITREALAEFLEECSVQTRRLIAPIFKYKIVEKTLENLLEQARERGAPLDHFLNLIESQDVQIILKRLRNRIDADGEKAADQMLNLYNACWETFIQDRVDMRLAKEQEEPRIADMETLAQVLNWGEKCKKDGMLEWERGNWKEAYMSWKQADSALRRFRAPESNESENVMIDELHVPVLKNLSLVCTKLERWTDALDAADMAVALDDQDHKAWFRRACALEGLGRILEAKVCLDKIDEIAVGRPDRCRINKDTQVKRERYQFLIDKDKDTNHMMASRAMQCQVFSCNRVSAGTEPSGHALHDEQGTEKCGETRWKHLTRGAAEDLLLDLQAAYSDTSFQKQVFKLSRDVKKDTTEFLRLLPLVALPVQRTIMDRWGFEASEKGVVEMTHAIQEHTTGSSVSDKLRKLDDDVKRTLYGVMYSVICVGASAEQYVPRMEVRLNGSKEDDDIIDVDSD